MQKWFVTTLAFDRSLFVLFVESQGESRGAEIAHAYEHVPRFVVFCDKGPDKLPGVGKTRPSTVKMCSEFQDLLADHRVAFSVQVGTYSLDGVFNATNEAMVIGELSRQLNVFKVHADGTINGKADGIDDLAVSAQMGPFYAKKYDEEKHGVKRKRR
jgi:hypothetical protein